MLFRLIRLKEYETKMQQVKNFLLSLLFFIGISVLGIAVGFGVGYVVVVLNNEGLFTSWKQLDGDFRFETISDVTSQIVWANTSDGKLYLWDSNCYNDTNSCDQWVETEKIPEDLHNDGERPMVKGGSCEVRGFVFFRQPSGMVECAQGWFAGPEFGSVVYYALLDDGTIWTWHFSGSMIFDIVIPIFFAFGGLIVGIISFIFFIIRRSKKNINQSTEEVTSQREIS